MKVPAPEIELENIETDESNTIEAFSSSPAIDHEIQDIPIEPIPGDSQEEKTESKMENDEQFFLSNSCDDKLDQKSSSTNQKLGSSTDENPESEVPLENAERLANDPEVSESVFKDKKLEFSCPKCPKVCKTKISLTLHLNAHKKRPFICNLCQKTGKNWMHVNQEELDYHNDRYHTTIKCDYPNCNYEGNKINLQSHARKHLKDRKRKRKRNSTEENSEGEVPLKKLASQPEETSEETVEFQCPKCPKICPSKRSLTSHLTQHNLRPFICQLCPKTNLPSMHRTQEQLDYHIDRFHTKVKCEFPDCNYEANKYEMSRHVDRIHMGTREFKCDHCDYAAGDLNHLKRHIEVHTNDKRFKCQWCDYRSNQSGNTKNHEKLYCKYRTK